MGEVSTIGLDIAKNVFQAHGADASGAVLFRKRLRRAQVLAFFAGQPPVRRGDGGLRQGALLGARDRQARPHGAADPAGLCEAVREAAEERCGRCRGDLRGGAAADHALRGGQERGSAGCGARVPGSGSAGAAAHPNDQRPARSSRRVRHRLSPRAAARRHARRPWWRIRHLVCRRRPGLSSPCWSRSCGRLDRAIADLDREIARRAKADETARRLMTIPGIGPITATALLALAPPAADLQARTRLRRLARTDAAAALDRRQAAPRANLEDGRANAAPPADHRRERRRALGGPQWRSPGSWLARMLRRKPPMLVRVALANKMARIVWALLAKGGVYRAPAAAA